MPSFLNSGSLGRGSMVTDDDVRSSLAILDMAIDEFDHDGAESSIYSTAAATQEVNGVSVNDHSSSSSFRKKKVSERNLENIPVPSKSVKAQVSSIEKVVAHNYRSRNAISAAQSRTRSRSANPSYNANGIHSEFQRRRVEPAKPVEHLSRTPANKQKQVGVSKRQTRKNYDDPDIKSSTDRGTGPQKSKQKKGHKKNLSTKDIGSPISGRIQPPSATEANLMLEKMLPRFTPPSAFSNRRQKSMLDLRDPSWDHPRVFNDNHMPVASAYHRQSVVDHGGSGFMQQNHRTSMAYNYRPFSQPQYKLSRSATEMDMRIRDRRSVAVGPYEDLPPHLRRHTPVEMSSQPRYRNYHREATKSKFVSKADQKFAKIQDAIALEAQREFLIRRGYSPSHPYISGEVEVHPELQGKLPFKAPSRTIPLTPLDYQRFRPEFWFDHPSPHRVSFNDLAVLHNDLDIQREQEITLSSNRRGVGRSSSFSSLPWLDSQEIPPLRSTSKAAAWFKPKKSLWRSATGPARNIDNNYVKRDGHWLLREKSNDLHSESSSPSPTTGTLRDSGFGDDTKRNSGSSGSFGHSSFGLGPKDRLQGKLGMYLPLDHERRILDTSECVALPDDSETNTICEDQNVIGSVGSSTDEGKNSMGNSSLSPHNSIEGSPRMMTKSKTIRNYTPKVGMTMKDFGIRRIQDERKFYKSSVDNLVDEFQQNLTASDKMEPYSKATSTYDDTMTSMVSEWSVTSSSASFDYLPYRKESSHTNCGGRDLVDNAFGVARSKNVHDMKINHDAQFSHLGRLISEGHISGLNEMPPSFIPPSPPITKKEVKNERRMAPKPPSTNVGSRPQRPLTMADLHRDIEKGMRAKVKRSSSNQGSSGYEVNTETGRNTCDNLTAQLIADSIEKKINFNPFKAMWKKKHYSFNFN